MANNDIIVSEMTSATQINTGDLMIMTQPDAQAETGYSTKKGTVLQVSNKMLKDTEYTTDLPSFTDKNVLGGLEELKGDIASLLPVDEASGAIANFETALALPLVSVLADVLATGGNGTPDNPNPINGYTEANITRCGVNLWDKTSGQVINGYFGGSGPITANTSTRVVYVKCNPNTTYTVSKTVGQRFSVAWFETVPDVGIQTNGNVVGNTSSSLTITTGATAKYLGAYVFHQSYDTGTADEMIASVQIEVGSTASAYTPYNGDTVTIAFGQTVYGGVLDVTRGKLHVTKGYGLLDETVNPFASNFGVGGYVGYTPSSLGIDNIKTDTLFVSNCYLNTDPNKISVYGGNILINDSRFGSTINSLADWNDWLTNTSNVQFIYELATPFDIDLTPEVISAIVGENNVFADCGGVDVKFKDGIQHYIDKKIAQTQALIL